MTDTPLKHPSQKAAKEHHRRGESMCAACFELCPHGTPSGYRNWGCRCAACQQASGHKSRTDIDIQHPSIKAAKEHHRLGEPMCSACFERCPHGLESGYIQWCCRCVVCKGSRVAKKASAYQDNKEAILEQQRKYYKENREAILEQQRKYRAQHPDSAYQRQYYQEHKDRIIERSRQWVADNKEKKRERARKWDNANPEKTRAYQQKYYYESGGYFKQMQTRNGAL